MQIYMIIIIHIFIINWTLFDTESIIILLQGTIQIYTFQPIQKNLQNVGK